MFSAQESVLVLLVVLMRVLEIAVPCAIGYWIFSRTRMGRAILRRSPDPDAASAMTGELNAMQQRIEELDSRLDFAERLLTEQREELRALGIHPRPALQHEPTPV